MDYIKNVFSVLDGKFTRGFAKRSSIIDKIRWGVLGTGSIARQFARGLAILPDAELVAVGSRSQASADTFGNEFNVPHRYARYTALADDPDVDVVYVATPHNLHRENSLLCLQAGKAVLCEKPFAINATQAEEIVALAREKQLFLMEAMWTRFLPILTKTRQVLADGTVGDVRMVMADFGFRAAFDPQSRLFDPNLGGGALLDVGIYPISLASMVFGSPTRISSMAHLGQTGVDEQSAMILGYDQGQLAVLTTAVRTKTPHEATLIGTKGQIRVHAPWWQPTRLTLSVQGKRDRVTRLQFKGNGYNYEAVEVMNCLRSGKMESDVMPLDETLAIMRTMDQIRTQWGLHYPME
ncbi:MAG: Gfo/Idh/MocA family oxidoreductase [Chloroflexi bacterium]|nr:Gfo/Idh/MocA family oxidoreductase [Chloroflexota bacterium]